MRPHLHVWSLAIGMLGGAGLTLLAGAAASGPREAAPGRYQLRATARDNTTTAYVVDTVTGEIAIVQEHGGGGAVIKPQWGK